MRVQRLRRILSTVRNIQIRQTYIEEQVNHILNYYDYEKESEAFQALVLGLLLSVSVYFVTVADTTDSSRYYI
jgi:hypothetical protein